MDSHAALFALAAHTTKTTLPAAVTGQAPPVPALTGTGALVALLGFVAVMVLVGKADALARLPLVIIGTVASVAVNLTIRTVRGVVRTAARKLNFRWPQWCWLIVTFLFVGDAQRHGVAPSHAWAAVGMGWAVWGALRLRRSVRQRSADRHHVKTKKRNAEALEANTKALGRGTRKAKAAPKPTAARTPRQAKPPQPTAKATPATHDPDPDRFDWARYEQELAAPKPGPQFEPVLPRWVSRLRFWRRGQ